MFRVRIGEYEVCCQADGLPTMLSEYRQRATLAEDFGVADEAGSSVCFSSVGRPQQWPFLVVVRPTADTCRPAVGVIECAA